MHGQHDCCHTMAYSKDGCVLWPHFTSVIAKTRSVAMALTIACGHDVSSAWGTFLDVIVSS